jgi:uncharacterized protein YidB (DUF937 family)
MSILDKMTDMLAGSNGGGVAAAQILSSLTNQPGGVGAILAKLEGAGLGEVVRSWMGKGENMPVTGSQIQNALGGDLLSKLASSTGVSNGSAAAMIARFLPVLVNKLTPGGKIPAGGIQEGQLLKSLSSLFPLGGKSEAGESLHREGLPRA